MFIDLIAGSQPNFVQRATVVEAIQRQQKEDKSISYRNIRHLIQMDVR